MYTSNLELFTYSYYDYSGLMKWNHTEFELAGQPLADHLKQLQESIKKNKGKLRRAYRVKDGSCVFDAEQENESLSESPLAGPITVNVKTVTLMSRDGAASYLRSALTQGPAPLFHGQLRLVENDDNNERTVILGTSGISLNANDLLALLSLTMIPLTHN